jgi:hypothetical protein
MKFEILLVILLFLCTNLFSQDYFEKAEFDTVQLINSQWFKFYKSQNNALCIKSFNQLEFKKSITYTQGNIFADFDSKFSKCNKSFIIESPDKGRYIDFLSYNSLVIDSHDSCKILGFEVDQEVDLVNRVIKTVKRIGFLGSYETIEDAFWVDNSRVVLLCCEMDQQKGIKLFLEFMDFETHEYSLFTVPDFFQYSALYLQRKYGFK